MVTGDVCEKVRSPCSGETKIRAFDAPHERRRKDQLEKLFQRTEEQVGCLHISTGKSILSPKESFFFRFQSLTL